MGVSPVVQMNFSAGGTSPGLAERDAALLITMRTEIMGVASFQIAAEYKT
jgi:hypothetical protein